MSARSKALRCLLLSCCVPWLSACAPESEVLDDAIKVTSFYRFVDEHGRDPKVRHGTGRVWVEHRSVLRAGFRPVRPAHLNDDGTIPLGELVSLDSLHTEATGLSVVARGPRGSFDTYTEVPETGLRDDLASHPVRITSNNKFPEELSKVQVVTRERFPDAYISRRLVVPGDARLEFGIGRDGTFKWPQKKPVRFEVVIEHESTQEIIFFEVLKASSVRLLQGGGGRRARAVATRGKTTRSV